MGLDCPMIRGGALDYSDGAILLSSLEHPQGIRTSSHSGIPAYIDDIPVYGSPSSPPFEVIHAAALGGVVIRTVANDEYGQIDFDAVEAASFSITLFHS